MIASTSGGLCSADPPKLTKPNLSDLNMTSTTTVPRERDAGD
jgi:hypothetical protein